MGNTGGSGANHGSSSGNYGGHVRSQPSGGTSSGSSSTGGASGGNNPPEGQRAFTGTVTKIHSNFGFVDEDVFFQHRFYTIPYTCNCCRNHLKVVKPLWHLHVKDVLDYSIFDID